MSRSHLAAHRLYELVTELRMPLKGCAIGLMFFSLAAVAADAPDPLSIYPHLLTALTTGKNVSVTVQFNECTVVGTGSNGPVVTGGFRIESFIVPGNRHIAFADVHQTLNAQNQQVTEYVRYRVTPDDNVSVRTASLTVSTGEVRNEAEYSCAIGKGIKFRW